MIFNYREFKDLIPNLYVYRIDPPYEVSEIYMFPVKNHPTPSNTGTNVKRPDDAPAWERVVVALLWGAFTVAVVGGGIWMFLRYRAGLPPFNRSAEPFDPIVPRDEQGGAQPTTNYTRNRNMPRNNIPNQTNRRPPLLGIGPNPMRGTPTSNMIGAEKVSIARQPPISYPHPVSIRR
jgi:hypothetical protein